MLAHILVVGMNLFETIHQGRYEQHHDPGAVNKLGQEDDDNDYAGHNSAQPVNAGIQLLVFTFKQMPVFTDGGLGNSKRQEHAQSVQGNQVVHVAVKDNHEQRRAQGQ